MNLGMQWRGWRRWRVRFRTVPDWSMLSARNPLGLLSEDLDPSTGELWGNYPQTYSLVGIINAATRLSESWEDNA